MTNSLSSDAVQPRFQPPFRWGYAVTLGGLGAIVTGMAIYNLRGIVFSVFLAAFATVGLDPLVRWFQRRGMTRTWGIVTVILLIVALLVSIVWVVLPLVISQINALATSIPAEIQMMREQGWFDQANAASNGVIGTFATWLTKEISDPKFIAAAGAGVVGLGFTIANAIASGFFIAILTIYFIGAYDATKRAAFRLVAASRRAAFTGYTERILGNVGKYLSGMVILAFINAVYSLILLLLVGVPGAFLIALLAFFITLIPLVGTILTTIAMTVLALFHSPTSALIVLIFMLIYMQVEAYVLTPKVMSKAVKIPGSVVLISALAGGTLFGLAGALMAIPISAGVILIITEVVMPRKDTL
ncbi:AI-2E family transporter [Glaciibacter psychrotolerans]|uniref:Putative PurR-regulated permease PerM n=1 Tax=Glaciibacter psychrotolerans TaxID=670054 RepID=A0A7Z0J791_9MICO|nr:AI-2E family transporter [Leifsonia psychrotolerans]NYJ20689.1 putative PurR-regulated permease PerM [Leifsonia psychrotolerans]